MRRIVLLCLCLNHAASGVCAERPAIAGTDDPFSRHAVYFVVTDRFVDGDSTNNYPDQGGGNRSFDRPLYGENGEEIANIGYLGGDFAGILSQAEYLRDLGFTAVWGTPVVDNPNEAFTGGLAPGEGFPTDKGKTGYHGYWGVNFYREDEHLVSEGLDFRTFVSRLNESGLSYVLDIVANHGSPSFDMPADQPMFGELYDADGSLVADHQNLHPGDLALDEPLHEFFLHETDLGQLSNLDYKSEAVFDYLYGSYAQWLEAGVEAVRIDTIRHMPLSFWRRLAGRLRADFPNLFLFAEHFSYDPEEIAVHTHSRNGAISVLDFPLQDAMRRVFGSADEPMSELAGALFLDSELYGNPYELMTFYDNHDMPRLDAADSGFIDAHHFLFTSRGIPVVYYGSEIGFERGRPEHGGNRNFLGAERLARARWHPIHTGLRRIARLRQASAALQRGRQINREFGENHAVFWRLYQDAEQSETAVVALHKGESPREVDIEFPFAGQWENRLTGEILEIPAPELATRRAVPAHGVEVWFSTQPLQESW